MYNNSGQQSAKNEVHLHFSDCFSRESGSDRQISSDPLNAKFHYASLFGAGLKLVRAKFHYTSWFGAVRSWTA